jgi:hypothetical protein
MTQKFSIEMGSLWSSEDGQKRRVCGTDEVFGICFDKEAGQVLDLGETAGVQKKFKQLMDYWTQQDLPEMMESLAVVSFPVNDVTVNCLNTYCDGTNSITAIENDLREYIQAADQGMEFRIG